jgi:hypothetical protein
VVSWAFKIVLFLVSHSRREDAQECCHIQNSSLFMICNLFGYQILWWDLIPHERFFWENVQIMMESTTRCFLLLKHSFPY